MENPQKQYRKSSSICMVTTTQKTKQSFKHLGPKPHAYTLRTCETQNNPPQHTYMDLETKVFRLRDQGWTRYLNFVSVSMQSN